MLPVFVCLSCQTKYYRLGYLNNRDILSQGSKGRESKIKMSSNLIPSEASLPGHLPAVPSYSKENEL